MLYFECAYLFRYILNKALFASYCTPRHDRNVVIFKVATLVTIYIESFHFYNTCPLFIAESNYLYS